MNEAVAPGKHVLEIDGVPQAYMELFDGTNLVRFRYRTIRFFFLEEGKAKEFVEYIRGKIVELLPNEGIIIWRRRPDVQEEVYRGKSKFSVYMRFETSPPLPPAFWAMYGATEGSITAEWKPSCTE